MVVLVKEIMGKDQVSVAVSRVLGELIDQGLIEDFEVYLIAAVPFSPEEVNPIEGKKLE